jgi:hypothetical protein
MNTIVFNLGTLAVTEYTPVLTGISDNFEAAADGIYKQSGTEAITSVVTMGLDLSETRQHPRYVYVAGTNLGSPTVGTVTISDSGGASYSYANSKVHDRIARFELGRGLRDNYLSASLQIVGSTEVVIDEIEFVAGASNKRRL